MTKRDANTIIIVYDRSLVIDTICRIAGALNLRDVEKTAKLIVENPGLPEAHTAKPTQNLIPKAIAGLQDQHKAGSVQMLDRACNPVSPPSGGLRDPYSARVRVRRAIYLKGRIETII